MTLYLGDKPIASVPDLQLIEEEVAGKVSKSGDTMTGTLGINKELTDYTDNPIVITATDIDFTTTPESSIWPGIFQINDKNGNRMGRMEIYQYESGPKGIAFGARKSPSEATYSVMQTGFDSDGNAYCQFPNTKRCDGQWIPTNFGIASNVGLNGSSNLTYNISSQIPDDGYNYELLIWARGASDNTAGRYSPIYISTSLMGSNYCLLAATRTTYTNNSVKITFGGSCVIPLGTDRNIRLVRSTGYYGELETLDVLSYRRIGLNS